MIVHVDWNWQLGEETCAESRHNRRQIAHGAQLFRLETVGLSDKKILHSWKT